MGALPHATKQAPQSMAYATRAEAFEETRCWYGVAPGLATVAKTASFLSVLHITSHRSLHLLDPLCKRTIRHQVRAVRQNQVPVFRFMIEVFREQ